MATQAKQFAKRGAIILGIAGAIAGAIFAPHIFGFLLAHHIAHVIVAKGVLTAVTGGVIGATAGVVGGAVAGGIIGLPFHSHSGDPYYQPQDQQKLGNSAQMGQEPMMQQAQDMGPQSTQFQDMVAAQRSGQAVSR